MSHEPLLSEDKIDGHNLDPAPPFKVALAYDDRNAALRAWNVLNGLVRQFGEDFEFNCSLWRFDVLGLPEAQALAVRAGGAADLLIVAAQCDSDLPASVRDWLEQSVAEKAPGSAALVALLEPSRGFSPVHRRTRQLLQSAADRGLIDFFLHEADPLQTTAETPAFHPARGWGINE